MIKDKTSLSNYFYKSKHTALAKYKKFDIYKFMFTKNSQTFLSFVEDANAGMTRAKLVEKYGKFNLNVLVTSAKENGYNVERKITYSITKD